MRSKTSFRANGIAVAALGAAAASLAIAVAGCGSSPKPSATPTGSNTVPTPSFSPTPSGTAALIGGECSMIPAKGLGSARSMSTQDAIAAASSNPQLSVFIAAVRTAGLDNTLKARHAYTLMIPANSAFASLSKTQIIHLKNSGELQKVVRYHAVGTHITPQQFASGASVATFEGSRLTFSKSGSEYKVGSATVLCGNIRTANATVYIVSKVLLPPK